MFKIFTFKQIAIISFFLCLIMLLGSFLNTLAPYVDVFSDIAVEVPIIMYHQISENKSKLLLKNPFTTEYGCDNIYNCRYTIKTTSKKVEKRY